MQNDMLLLLKESILKAKKILLLSHAKPDQDAISSTYFALKTLQYNFSQKSIRANIESSNLEQWKQLFDPKDISSELTIRYIKAFQPDLIIVFDTSQLGQICKDDIRNEFVAITKNTDVYVIDHHESKLDIPNTQYSFNQKDNSCAETVYTIFIEIFKYKKYKGYQNHLLFGIVGDTGAFSYLKTNPKKTFSIAAKLVSDGGNIDQMKTMSDRLTKKQVEVHLEMLKNLTTNHEYTYSFVSDEFYNKRKDISESDFSTANKSFVQKYLKTLEDALWGFAIKPSKKGLYSVSFRAPTGYMDLKVFANKFNGGGHKDAAGGAVEAKSAQEAVQKVIQVIEENKAGAYITGK